MSVRFIEERKEKPWEVYVKVKTPNGKPFQRRSFVSNEKEAIKLEARYKEQLLFLRDKPKRITWKEWFDRFLDLKKHQVSRATLINYVGRLNKWVTPIWKEKFLDEISSSDVGELIFTHIGSELSKRSQKNILKMLRTIFQAAIIEGHITKDPSIGLKVRVPQSDLTVLNNVEVETLLRAAFGSDHEYKYIWAIGLFTGLRSGELWELRWRDIDKDSKFINLSRSWSRKNGIGPTKSSNNRLIPISNELRLILNELRFHAKSIDDAVIPCPRPRSWHSGEQSRELKNFCRQLGITLITFHGLRRTFLTNLASSGLPTYKIMTIAGHAQSKTTDIYVKRSGIDLNGATETLTYKMPNNDLAGVVNLDLYRSNK